MLGEVEPRRRPWVQAADAHTGRIAFESGVSSRGPVLIALVSEMELCVHIRCKTVYVID
jgi:hypothetical protein